MNDKLCKHGKYCSIHFDQSLHLSHFCLWKFTQTATWRFWWLIVIVISFWSLIPTTFTSFCPVKTWKLHEFFCNITRSACWIIYIYILKWLKHTSCSMILQNILIASLPPEPHLNPPRALLWLRLSHAKKKMGKDPSSFVAYENFPTVSLN